MWDYTRGTFFDCPPVKFPSVQSVSPVRPSVRPSGVGEHGFRKTVGRIIVCVICRLGAAAAAADRMTLLGSARAPRRARLRRFLLQTLYS